MTSASGKVSFGRDLSVDELTITIESVATIEESAIDQLVTCFNTYGFAILQCEPCAEPRANLLALAPFFGRVVPHNRSNRQGVLAVNAEKPVPGFIDSSHDMHPPHTDGAFKPNPEKLIALQCVKPAKSGGTSLLGSGKLAHDMLTESSPEDIRPLYAADAISIQRNNQNATKSVFSRDGDRVGICFRKDEAASTVVKESARDGFDRLKRIIDDNLLRFGLQPHQILLVDNRTLVHGRDPFSPGADRQYFRLNFDGDGLLDLNFGFVPDRPLPDTPNLSA